MASHEVTAVNIWVGDTEPTTVGPEDFWLDVTQVPATAVPGVEYPGTIMAPWTGGGISFFVNGSTATVQYNGLISPAIAAEAWSQVCAFPAGVPAPFATLRFLTVMHSPATGGYDNPAPIEVRADGVWIGAYASRAVALGKMFVGAHTWAI